MTDQDTVTSEITATSEPYYSDLSTIVTTNGVMLDYLPFGNVFLRPSVTVNPYILSGGTYASGYWTFNVNPQNAETIAVNGVTFTFKYTPVVVASAGGALFNGTYDYAGELNGKPSYSFTPGDTYFIRYIDSFWKILDDEYVAVYASEFETDVDFPWEVELWETVGSGVAPAPTVTPGTLGATEVEVGATLSATIANFITTLNASANASITVATYTTGEERGKVIGTYDTQGTGGNAFALANSSLASVVRSNATFTGGASTAYALAIGSFTTYFDELSRVQFTTTGSLPTGISASTNYYLTNYTIDGDTATFGLSSTADGLTPVTISTAGSGVLTMASQSTSINIQWINSPSFAQLTSALPINYIYGWLQADRLYLTGAVSGTLSFNCPYVPTLAELPSFLENDLVDEIVDLYLAAGNELPKSEAQK